MVFFFELFPAIQQPNVKLIGFEQPSDQNAQNQQNENQEEDIDTDGDK